MSKNQIRNSKQLGASAIKNMSTDHQFRNHDCVCRAAPGFAVSASRKIVVISFCFLLLKGLQSINIISRLKDEREKVFYSFLPLKSVHIYINKNPGAVRSLNLLKVCG